MVVAPVNAMLLLVLAGAILTALGRRRWGAGLMVAGALALVACGILPVGTLLLRPLEDRFPPLPAAFPAPSGIIVLGGSSDQALSAARGRVTIVEAADRLTDAVILSRRYPTARLVFTGGSASLAGITFTEAADARRLWTDLGVDDARITTEDRSRNTEENVKFSKVVVDPKPGQTWVLVTSAYHMPRAVGLFRANGWSVVPDPVDYRTRRNAADLRPNVDMVAGLARFNMAVREWVGLIAYFTLGKTQSVLPEP